MKSEWNLLAEHTGMTVIVEELETAFTSWAEYSMNTFQSQAGAEAGAVIYKHTTNLPSYGIMLSRNIGIVSIWRNSEGTWKYKHILSCNC